MRNTVRMDDRLKVFYGKLAALVLGIVAMGLGIAFRQMNVTFLVGWAFNIAASANLPALAQPPITSPSPVRPLSPGPPLSRRGRHPSGQPKTSWEKREPGPGG